MARDWSFVLCVFAYAEVISCSTKVFGTFFSSDSNWEKALAVAFLLLSIGWLVSLLFNMAILMYVFVVCFIIKGVFFGIKLFPQAAEIFKSSSGVEESSIMVVFVVMRVQMMEIVQIIMISIGILKVKPLKVTS